MASFPYKLKIANDVLDKHYEDIYLWLVERAGESVLRYRGTNPASTIVHRIRTKCSIEDIEVSEKWFWLDEYYHFSDYDIWFEFKMRWG